MHSRRALAWAPLLVALAYLLPFVHDLGGDLVSTYNVSAVLSAVVVVVAVSYYRPQPARPWILLAGFVTIWALGDVVYGLVSGGDGVTLAEPLYFLGYAALILGTWSYVGTRIRQPTADTVIDAAMVTVAGVIGIWYLVVAPAWSEPGATTAARLLTAAYPLLDLVVLALLVQVVLVRGRRIRPATLLLVLAMATILTADIGYAVLQQTASYEPFGHMPFHEYLDGAWLLGYALVAAAAMHPSMMSTSPPVEAESSVFRLRHLVTPAIALSSLLLVPGPQDWVDIGDVVAFGIALSLVVPLVLLRIARMSRAVARSRRQLADREEYFRAMATNSSDTWLVMDAAGTIVDVSAAATSPSGLHISAEIGTNGSTLVHPEDTARMELLFARLLEAPAVTMTADVRIRGADGSWRWVETRSINLLHDPAVRGIVTNAHDITTRKQAEDDLVYQAFHDGLTGIANRSLVKDRLTNALARCERDRSDVAVVFCDLDGFKKVNDSFGHDVGDDLLRVVAERLRDTVRAGDTVARFGGDEFAVVLEGTDVVDEARIVAERMRLAISDPIVVRSTAVMITGSMGIASARDGAASADDLLAHADTAMYAAKAAGRDRVMRYQPAMSTAILDRLELEADLRGVAGRGELFLEYQPIVELESNRIAGLEALVRWNHPTRGRLLPGTFIGLAEETGEIAAIGRWVLREACRAAAQWQPLPAPDARPIVVGVNLSARQLEDPALADDVKSALSDAGLPAGALVVELTESALVERPVDAAETLARLKELGITIAIDDFGTGYSSLSYLRQFPIDILKLDRSFVESIDHTERVPPIVRGLLDLGRTLKLTTLAEGVETEEQRRSLTSEGCVYGQGFLFARPLAERAVAPLLRLSSPASTPTSPRW